MDGYDYPVANFSSEAPDRLLFIGLNWGWDLNLPPLGTNWNHDSCLGMCYSSISQADADLCAARNQLLCLRSDGYDPAMGDGGPGEPTFPAYDPPSLPTYYNQVQICSYVCPDGTINWGQVNPGEIAADSQQRADNLAHQIACRRARYNAICLGPLFDWFCSGELLADTYIPVLRSGGPGPYVFTLASGELPTGLTLSAAGAVYGTPTVPDIYTFTVRMTNGSGRYADKSYTIYIMGISNADSLPDGKVGTAYSEALTGAGGVAPYTFALADGYTLPGGLTLAEDGTLSGTPTNVGIEGFGVRITDSTGGTCEQIVTLNVVSGVTYKICRWDSEVLPALTLFIDGGGCVISANPAWNGVFNRQGTRYRTSAPAETGAMYYYINQSTTVGGIARASAASDIAAYPAGEWNDFDQYIFSCLYWRADVGRWYMNLGCASDAAHTSRFWYGRGASLDPNDASGVYDVFLGPGCNPLYITVAKENDCCCIEDIEDPPPAYQGSIYYHFFATPTFGVGPYTFSAPVFPNSGSLPQGLTLLATGQVTGTPLNLGTTTAHITITDSLGMVSCCDVDFVVQASDWLDSISWTWYDDPYGNFEDYDVEGAFGWIHCWRNANNHQLSDFSGTGNNTTGSPKTVRVKMWLANPSTNVNGRIAGFAGSWPADVTEVNFGTLYATHDYVVGMGAFTVSFYQNANDGAFDFQLWFTMEII